MGTLVYAPAIMVTIATQTKGIIDVSEDVSSASITLNTGSDGGHQLTMRLTNIRRKYDGIFTPNDRIVVHLKRIRWLQIFSGYLNSVPAYSVYSGSVVLSASCTLKRLRYTLYDPGSQHVVNLLNSRNTIDHIYESRDSDLDLKIRDVLEQIVGWDPNQIRIGGVPADWFEHINGLYRSLKSEFDFPAHLSGQMGDGSPLMYGARRVRASSGDNIYEEGPGYGILPVYNGRAVRQTERDAVEVVQPATTPYYCMMRWPYRGQGGLTTLSKEEIATARAWWARQRIMVHNPKTAKAVICQPVGWGPANEQFSIAISPEAYNELGLTADGESIDIRFARGNEFGPFVPTANNTAMLGYASQVASSAISNIKGLFGSSSTSDDSAQPSAVVTHEGIAFVAEGKDKPHVNAARQFIKRNWQPPNGSKWSIGGYRSSSAYSKSDHHRGLALDVMVASGEPSDAQVAIGNQIAYWFCQNPSAFGVKYVIWNNMIYDNRGARIYTSSSYNVKNPTGGHRDHIHISFHDTNQTSVGPMGNGFPVTPRDFMTSAALGGQVHQNRASAIASPGTIDIAIAHGPQNLISAWNWYQQGDPQSNILAGPRLLLNDEPVWDLVKQLFGASLREFCSAPNGDIIGWWPDYFNLYGTAARMVVQTVELESFNIMWSDNNLITHQFVVGSTNGIGGMNAAAEMATRRMLTHGIATVEQPEILQSLINAEEGSPWLNPEAILQRFGARRNTVNAVWATSPEAEFWYAVHLFRKNWAYQFSTNVPLAFMPELFPGMILQIPYYGLQMYVASVEHTIELGPGGSGFATRATCVAPSTIGEQPGLYGLPKGGGWVGSEERGPAYGPKQTPVNPTLPPSLDPGNIISRINPWG